MRLKTKLRIIQYREKYMDLWEKLRSWVRKNDYWQPDDHPRWKIVATYAALWALDILYYGLGPFRSIEKRYSHARFTRVKGISRTTTRPLRTYTKEQRIKWKDMTPPLSQEQANALMDAIRQEFKNVP